MLDVQVVRLVLVARAEQDDGAEGIWDLGPLHGLAASGEV